jgi:Zn-dependent peptidase ImmA (M78 family)
MPQISSKKHIKSKNKMSNLIENKAQEILKKLNISSVPIPIEDVAGGFNILIQKAPSDKFSGLLFKKAGSEGAYIAINNKESVVRQRFTIAHELGHFFLHPQKNTFIEFRGTTQNLVKNSKEMEANRFAAAILMPAEFLLKDIESFASNGILPESITFLSSRYNVSEEAMKYRLMNLIASKI